MPIMRHFEQAYRIKWGGANPKMDDHHTKRDTTYRSADPVSKSSWSVVFPIVTGLKYKLSYASPGTAGAVPVGPAAAAARTLAGTSLLYLRSVFAIDRGPFLAKVLRSSWWTVKVLRLCSSTGVATTAPTKARAAVREAMEGILKVLRVDRELSLLGPRRLVSERMKIHWRGEPSIFIHTASSVR
jgi:hypothetical protein